jgi:Tol biopolymer transport system component
MTPSWSHDKQWVYFTTLRSGNDQIWKVRVQDSQEKQLTKQAGWIPQESADGQWVYYYSLAKPEAIWKVSVDGGQESRVLELPKGDHLFYYFCWTLAKHGIYYLDPDAPSGAALMLYDFASQEKKLIAQLDRNPSERITRVTVSPDDKWILYAVQSRPRNIMLVENFR